MGMGVSANVDIMAFLIFRRAFCYGISALVPQDASKSFNLIQRWMVFLICWMWCTSYKEYGMFMPFHAPLCICEHQYVWSVQMDTSVLHFMQPHVSRIHTFSSRSCLTGCSLVGGGWEGKYMYWSCFCLEGCKQELWGGDRCFEVLCNLALHWWRESG